MEGSHIHSINSNKAKKNGEKESFSSRERVTIWDVGVLNKAFSIFFLFHSFFLFRLKRSSDSTKENGWSGIIILWSLTNHRVQLDDYPFNSLADSWDVTQPAKVSSSFQPLFFWSRLWCHLPTILPVLCYHHADVRSILSWFSFLCSSLCHLSVLE